MDKTPGSSTSGTSHNKFSKMPPPTSMHLWTRCRVLRVARRSSWRRSFKRTQALLMRATKYLHACDGSCDVIYYVTAVRARRMVRNFFLPYLGNRSKSDPCSYEIFCLESHILSFSKVLQIPPESLYMRALSKGLTSRMLTFWLLEFWRSSYFTENSCSPALSG